jgi:putative tryptophan/tyrosine transport system substrate-binding protein
MSLFARLRYGMRVVDSETGMKRREFLILSTGVALAQPSLARAQSASVRMIGYLSTRAPIEAKYTTTAFLEGLRKGGYIDGRNVAIEYRWAELHYDRLPELASDLAHRQVDVIAAVGGAHSGIAAKRATKAIPIIFVSAGDPIIFGLVSSLSRPTENVTGVSMITVELAPKRLGLLSQLLPSGAAIAMLANPTSPYRQTEAKSVMAAATAASRKMEILDAATPPDIDAAFKTIDQRHFGGVLVSGDPFFDSQRDQLVTLAARYRVPTIYQWKEFAELGGLISYGTSITNAYTEAGAYTARILKGERPENLPVLQPTKFELVINLNTAKALGLTIPIDLQVAADEVIQ